ncbi:hypothetical protein [Roseateles sp.]|jgi:hypothetical protein|uniref:hypothetical protein n=1 Tax=Roseateles sp. TaxID=1971397 RepID=UPI0037C5ED9D
MRTLLLFFVLLPFGTNIFAQACWSEWEHGGEKLMRHSCTQNVSIPDPDRLCKSRIKEDEIRTAASCPATAKKFHKGVVIVEPVDFRCMGYKPPAAGGAANTFHYGLGKNQQDLEVVRNLCTQFGGKWEVAN